MGLERQPRPVVAGEDDQRAAVEPERAQRVEDPSGAPVELLDDVAVHAGVARVDELGGAGQRDVRQVVSQVKEERLALVRFDETHRFLGVAPGQRSMIDRLFDHRLAAHQRHVPILRFGLVVGGGVPAAIAGHRHLHVVRVGQPEPRVEALPHRQELGQVAEMPLADHPRGVALRLQQLGDRDLVGRQTSGGIGAKHPRSIGAVTAVHAVAHRQPAGEERRPARRTHRLDVERRPFLALGRHPVEPRRLDHRRAEGAEVAVAEVVGKNDDDVGPDRPWLAIAGGRSGEHGGHDSHGKDDAS